MAKKKPLNHADFFWDSLVTIVDKRKAPFFSKTGIRNLIKLSVFCFITTLSIALLYITFKDTYNTNKLSKPLQLSFETNGILSKGWFKKWTEFPEYEKNFSLLKIKNRALEYGQIKSISISKQSLSHIHVSIQERAPLARIKDESGKTFVISEDGIIFPIETSIVNAQSLLPYVTDAVLTKNKNGLDCLENAESFLKFISFTQSKYPDFFVDFSSISLKEINSRTFPRIIVSCKPLSQTPNIPKLNKIYFSTTKFSEELNLYINLLSKNYSFDENALKRIYDVYFIINKRNVNKQFLEMRLIPCEK